MSQVQLIVMPYFYSTMGKETRNFCPHDEKDFAVASVFFHLD